MINDMYDSNGNLKTVVSARMGARRPRLLPPALFDPTDETLVPVPGYQPLETPDLNAQQETVTVPEIAPDEGPNLRTGRGGRVRYLPPLPGAPALMAPPVRDMGQEGRRGTQAGLMALAFGIGQGRGQAPALGAAALRGTAAGAESAYQNQLRNVEGQNRQKLAFYDSEMDQYRADLGGFNALTDMIRDNDRNDQQLQGQQDEFYKSLRGLDEGSLQAALTNAEQTGRLSRLGISIPKTPDGRWQYQAVADPALAEREAARQAREAGALGDDRTALITQLAALAPEAQQTALTMLEQSGELARRNLTIPKTPDGRWDIGAFGKALPASMSPEAQAIERRKVVERSIQSTQDLFELLLRDPRTTAVARRELLKRQGILKDALATGKDVPNWVYEISPSAIADMSPQQREALRLRDAAIAASRERTMQMAGQYQQSYNQRERFHKDYVAGKKEKDDGKAWEREGIKSINSIDGDVAQLIRDVAELRNGPMQKTATGAFLLDTQGNPVRLKPSQNDLAAAAELVEKIKEYQRQQDDIAASYGYRRNPATRRWEKVQGGR